MATTRLFVLLAALASCAAACAAEPVFEAQDGRELALWKPWGDAGDRFVKLSQSTTVRREGRSSLRVEMRVVPGTSWWPGVGFEFPRQTPWANVEALELWLRPDGAVPDGLLSLTLQGRGLRPITAAVSGLKAGEWHQVLLRGRFTRTQESSALLRLKLAARPSALPAPATVVLHVDGLRLVAGTRLTKIAKLKDLCLNTVLAERGKPRAALVVPADGRYANAAAAVQQAIRRCAGIELPVRKDAEVATKDLLRTTHAIVLGNMATNAFVETLYCQWYAMTDLWYPGKGGHEVRSLHDPYGTGHNVILLGGSDDAGVDAAARAFAALLKRGDPLRVGWLMHIKLGDGMEPPRLGETIYTWHDSYRTDARGKGVGYAPGTYFAWNPVSLHAALYYMTGRREFLDHFLRLALPDPKNIPVELRTDSAFNNPLKPLVENYHYRAHLVDVLWDLIEESPLLADHQRLAITNLLLEHQNHYDPNDTFTARHGSRHGLWHMNCIYTGSRYFAKYYPHPRWEKRLANARRSFASFIGDPTWGELDTLGWVNTSTEPIFDFFLMDGYWGKFVRSGTARRMMSALEILWTGKAIEESNKCQSINLLRKAAWLLDDGRYLHMANAAGYDMGVFRVGQSFAPPPKLEPAPPLDRVGRVSAMPLSRHNWQRAGKTIPLEQGFQFLSYRSGVTAADDFVQLDGFFGRGRNPYHVNALYLLRMGGKLLLSGYDNQVAVRRQGMVEPHVAQAAALEAAASCGDAFYVRATVPDMPFSAWTRHILYLKGLYAIVLDEVRARAPGRFDIDCRWRVLGAASPMPRAPRCVQSRTGVTIACSVPASASTNGSHVTQSWSCKLGAGDTVALGNLVYLAAQRGKATHTAEPVGRRGLLVRGDGKALACFGPRRLGAIEVKAEAAYLSRTRLFGAEATLVACGTPLLTADKPVGFLWNLAGGVLEIDASQPTHLEVQTEKGRAPRDLQAGRHTLSGCSPAPGAITALTKALDTMEPTPPQQAEQPQPLATGAKWEPDWTLKLDGRVSLLACSAHTRPPTVWAVAGDKLLVKVNADGKSLARRELSSRARSLWAASSRAQANAFAALVGCDDDHLLAFAADGAPRWNAEARIAPEFKIGDRYRAPWFTDPRRKHGVFSLLAGDLWGSGQEEIALGRSSTVELRSLDGRLLKRLPTHWGDNTALAAVRLPEPRLLVGKFYTGIPGLSIVDRKREVLTDSACAGIPRGATRMSAWMQQGVSHLATSDLDGDGAEETLVARSGHWNELAVYNAKGQCLWLASFGPAPSRSRFITGLAVADLDGDGKQEVAVGMANGWLCVFDARGQALWQRRLPSAVRALAAVRPGLVVGEAARVHLLSPSGNTVATAELEGAISALAPLGGTTCVAAGTASGDLVRLDVGKTVRRTAP